MKRNSFVIITLLVASVVFITACGSDDDATTTTPTNGGDTATLHAAFNEFDTNNVTIMLNGSNVEIETNGRPNHTSPYWSSTNAIMGTPTAA